MKKEKINFEQLVALSFLKFNKIDSIDITLLIKEIKDIADVVMLDDSDNYSVLTDGSVLLNKEYINKFYKNVDVELFASLEGSKVYNYIMSINMLEFVLKKIKFMGEGCVVKDEMDVYFSNIQRRFINLAYQNKYILDYTQKDKEYEDYCAVMLTKPGELFLFVRNNKTEVDEFYKMLQDNGYNVLLFDAFLIAQDLNLAASDVLTVDNFVSFCYEYGKDIYATDKNNGSLKRARIM